MDKQYYENQIKILGQITNESALKKISFFQHILLVSSSILGVIISLHTTNSQCLYIRLIFIVSTILLLLGILSLAVVLYDFSNLQERTRQSFCKEVQDALQNDEKCKMVTVNHKKRTLFLEKVSYIFLILGIFSLVTYNGLIAFDQNKIDKLINKKDLIIENIKPTINNPKKIINTETTKH